MCKSLPRARTLFYKVDSPVDHWAVIRDPYGSLVEDANALIFAMPRGTLEDTAVIYDQNIGVWLNGPVWVIFNQKITIPMPEGADMLKMRYNLLNGGGDMARSNRAAFLVNESRAQQEQTQRLVSEDLNLAWSTYKALRSQLIYTKQHVDASVQTLDAYNKQYAINQRTLLDLLDAHNELFEANRAYISAQYDSQYQQYRILANLGRLTPKLVASTSGN